MSCKPYSNLGVFGCVNAAKVGARLIFAPLTNSSGNPFSIAIDDLKLLVKMQLACDEVLPEDRIFPLPIIENVEDVRADSTFQEYNSGRKALVRQGTRAFNGVIPMEHSEFLESLLGWRGQTFGAYIVDIDGNIIFMKDSTDETIALPIPIEGGSFDAMLVKSTYSEANAIKVMFDFDISAKDERLAYVEAADLNYSALSKTDLYSLLDTKLTVSDITDTTFKLKVAALSKDAYRITSVVLADISMYNITGSAAITPASVVSLGDGEYTVTFPAATTGNSVRVTFNKSRFGESTTTFVAVAPI